MVDDLFRDFNALNKPSRVVDKKKVKKKIYKAQLKTFLEETESFLRKARELLQFSKSRWSELFHFRMQLHKDILMEEQFQRYYKVIKCYIKHTPEAQKALYWDVVSGLEKFLTTHAMDPDSALVGMIPDATILSKFAFYLENAQTSINYEAEVSQENLSRLIITWSKMDDLDVMVREVKRMASILGSVRSVDSEQLKMGDLVVASFKEEKEKKGVYFARFSGRREGSKLGVFLNPDERAEELVAATQVFPFTEDMKAALHDTYRMERLIEDPTKNLSRELNERIKKRTLSFLAQQGVDIEIIEKAVKLDVTIADLPTLQRTKANLLALHKTPPEAFLNEIDEYAKGEIKNFISNLGMRDIFIPTREKALQRLQSISWTDLSRVRIQRNLGTCEQALQHLQLEKRELMNGTTKDKTTEWWLSLIKDECDKFLDKRGYNNDVVPQDYLEQPPTNIQAVRDNLQLIKEILNPNEDKHQVQRLIKNLKVQIYPEIDRFISNAQIVLAEQFNMDYDNFSLDAAEAKFNSEKSTLSAEVREWIEDMFKDIHYLRQMKRLEKPQNCKEKILDIVPVTGLIVGRFYRLENELRTVLDVWSDHFAEQERAEAERLKNLAAASTSGSISSSGTSPVLSPLTTLASGSGSNSGNSAAAGSSSHPASPYLSNSAPSNAGWSTATTTSVASSEKTENNKGISLGTLKRLRAGNSFLASLGVQSGTVPTSVSAPTLPTATSSVPSTSSAHPAISTSSPSLPISTSALPIAPIGAARTHTQGST